MKRSALGAGQSRMLAGYEILFELGQGGMGAAYLARAAGGDGFERLVVIKRPLPRHPGDAETISRFLREARLAAAIHHANVAGTQQVGEDEHGPFIVLDYIDGASLSDLDMRCAFAGRPMPARMALRVVLDALAGLEAVHRATNVHGEPLHILHRDVSLGNILVGRDGVARLSDFGVAKSEPGKGHTNKQRYLVGKLPYVSPEYLRGGKIGQETDVYALGVTLWLALAGHDPWPEADDAQVMRHILDDGMPALPARDDVSPRLAELVGRACGRDPERRFASARELSDALEELDREAPCIAK
ncbi:MAG TPA: serine/threonine-protein kinase, partial [Polyangiaceae bacterium]